METILRICGTVICAVIATLILKDNYKTLASAVVIVTLVLVLIFTFQGTAGTLISQITDMYNGTRFGDYALILIKAMGISYVASITAQMCDICGEAGLSYVVGIGARCEILLLCVPLVTRLLNIANEVLG